MFGMPKEAIEIGAAEMVVPFNLIARRIMSNLAGMESGRFADGGSDKTNE